MGEDRTSPQPVVALGYRVSGNQSFLSSVAMPLIEGVGAARAAAGVSEDFASFSRSEYYAEEAELRESSTPAMSADVDPYYVAVQLFIGAEVGKWLVKTFLDGMLTATSPA